MKKMFVFSVLMLIIGAKTVYAQNEARDSFLLVPQIYDNIYCDEGNMIIVEKNRKKGVLNSEGKIIVPPEYDGIELPNKGNNCGKLIMVYNNRGKIKDGDRNRNYGLYNTNGEIVLSCDNSNYDRIYIQERSYGFEGLAEVSIFDKIKVDSLYEMVDKAGGVDYVFKGVNYRRLTNEGILLEDGILNTSYDSYKIQRFGIIKVEKNGKRGLIDKHGGVIVPVKYDDVDVYMNHLLRVEGDGVNGYGRGVLDDKGNTVIPIGKYKQMDIGLECLIVENNKQKGALSLKGVQVIPMGAYEKLYEKDCEDGRNHYICVYKDEKKGAANCNGKVFIPCGKYDSFKVLDNNLALVSLNSRKGLINRNGIVVIPIGKYAKIDYDYGMLYYSQDGKYGVIGKNGKQATLAIYDYIKPERHSDGIALVKKDGKIGVVDCEGHIIMPLGDYIDVKFYGNVGMLKSNEGTIFFLKNGKKLINYGEFEDAENKYGRLNVLKLDANEGLFVIESNAKKGVVKLW